MRNTSERKSSSSSSSPSLDCEVGLGLKMQLQPTDSYLCDGSRGGGGPFFSSTSNQLACVNGIYGVADTMVLQRSFHNRASEGMAGSGKALFTASQWQELERQRMIHKYILASITVPPELLLPTSTSSPAPTSLSQCNTSGLDLRFTSSGSDPEPWRCKRTDGKKWRCSRDVAPNQKYCERHGHKNRPRSRKLVETISSHNTTLSHKPLPSPTNFATTAISQFPTLTSATSYDQTRCIEWFMEGGSCSRSRSRSRSETNPVSTCKQQQQQQQQWEQLMQISSSRMELNRDNTDHNKIVPVSVCQPHFMDKQGFMSLNPYIPDAGRVENHNQASSVEGCNSTLDQKTRSLQAGTQTTRHFIDAWEKEAGFDGMSSSKGLPASSSKKFPVSPSSSSLSLSILCGGNDHIENSELGTGMIDADRDSYGIMKPQWMMNSVPWTNSSAPGGPLGEALCLGNATTTRGGLNSASAGRGYSNTNVTNSSSCSKSSGEDGSHALNFIG